MMVVALSKATAGSLYASSEVVSFIYNVVDGISNFIGISLTKIRRRSCWLGPNIWSETISPSHSVSCGSLVVPVSRKFPRNLHVDRTDV